MSETIKRQARCSKYVSCNYGTLSENNIFNQIIKAAMQVIISTHSSDFVDAQYIDGLVRVYKEQGITKVKQMTATKLLDFCLQSGVPEKTLSLTNIVDFYITKVMPDQLKGMFAEKIILVEGATEYFTFPEYFKQVGYSCAANGIEIINCQGKESIALFWRLFTAFGFKCFVVFDGDMKPEENTKCFLGIFNENWEISEKNYYARNNYLYFGKDLETYLRLSIDKYCEYENSISNALRTNSKPCKARAIAIKYNIIPAFVPEIIHYLDNL